MNNIKIKRKLRAQKTRLLIKNSDNARLCIHRSNSHIYVQLIDDKEQKTIVAASTLELKNTQTAFNGGNIAAAILVGKNIAEKAKKQGILKVAFDRSGYKYHGRVKALADAARENGLNF